MADPQPVPHLIRAGARRPYLDFAFLAVLDAVAHFWRLRSFGLYEDDWYFNVGPYVWAARDWFGVMFRQMREYVFGRPVEILLLYTNGYIGYSLDSVTVLYGIAFLYSVVATILVYVVLRHRFARDLALLAAMLFVLSPLTTVRQFLNTAYKMAPAYALVMGAMLLWLRRRPAPAYLLGGLSLLTYEWLFLLFLGAPLLERDLRFGSRRLWLHVAVCVLIMAAGFALRLALEEQRVGVEVPEAPYFLSRAAHSLFFHLANIPLLFGNAVYLAVADRPLDGLVFGALLAGLLLWTQWRHSQAHGANADWPRAIAAGAAFAILGLLLAFLPNPSDPFDTPRTLGRVTRVFGPAEFGVALLGAGLYGALHSAAGRPVRRLLTPALAGGLGVLMVFQFVIQKDYVRAWEEHRSILARMIQLSPDAGPDTTIVIRLRWRDWDPFNTRFRVLAIGEEKLMFHRAPYWLFAYGEPRPNLYFVYSDRWLDHLQAGADGKLHWTRTDVPDLYAFDKPPLTPGKVIYLHAELSGRIVRATEAYRVGDTVITQASQPVQKSFWTTLKPSPLLKHVFPAGLPVDE